MIDPQFWIDRRVFITGHTGFKGAWMSLVLTSCGAKVYGYALAPENEHDLFVVGGLRRRIQHTIGDVRELSSLRNALNEAQPSVIFHLAAQSLVRRSYVDPVTTYATNVMGTVNLLEATRSVRDVQAVVVVTSDKCYENNEQIPGYREIDPLGGRDPYSNSKGCAELVTAAYRSSFYQSDDAARIASARAGNVIGGGDWAHDRLVPDAMRAFLAGTTLKIRNPDAVRPWQHVIDPVLAYILLAERLALNDNAVAESWNFGPDPKGEVSVKTVANALVRCWDGDARWEKEGMDQRHEADRLTLDCSKARSRLHWRPTLDLEQAIQLTVDWYRAFGKKMDMEAVTLSQIEKVTKQ